VLLWRKRIYIPDPVMLREEIITQHHNSELANHLGYTKTYELIIRNYVNVKYRAEQDGVGQSEVELLWNERFDNKMGNNLGLSSCAVPRSAVTCVVAYFRRTELLSGVSERSDID